MDFLPPSLPVEQLMSRKVMMSLVDTHAAIAELRGLASTIPNQKVLRETLVLQEARGSSEIENIITTIEDIYRSGSAEAKEVRRYARALDHGERLIARGFISVNMLIKIQ